MLTPSARPQNWAFLEGPFPTMHGGEPENIPLALMGRFASSMGRFPDLTPRFSIITSVFYFFCRITIGDKKVTYLIFIPDVFF